MGYLLFFLWYIKKCIFLNVIVGTFYQYLPYFQNKLIGKICNMKKKKKKFYREKKPNKIWFSKKPFQKVHLEKGGQS